MTDYWKRRNEEMKHIQSMFQTDEDYRKGLDKIYSNAQANIQKEIDAELMRYAGRENLSMDEAKKKITKFDVESFKNKAEKYVKEKNFSPQANDQLKTYNVKMRMNRAELLNQQIQLETIALADAENKLLTARLDNEAHQEYRRQAGILGESVPSPEQLSRVSKAIVESDFKGTNFSNRVWVNQSELQKGLEQTIQRTLIQGKHPREGARDLRRLVGDSFKNSKYAADRIAITESARVQDSIQEKAYEEFGVEEYEWIAESGACDECGSYDGEIFKVGDASAPRVPIHPFCRCSRAAYVDRKAWEKEFDERVTAELEETMGVYTPDPHDFGNDEEMEDWFEAMKGLQEMGIEQPQAMYRGMDEELFTENSRQIKRLEERFNILEKFDSVRVKTENLGNEVAYVSYVPSNPRDIELKFNQNLYSSSKKTKELVEKNVKDGFFMPIKGESVEKQLYPITHEYGHIIQTTFVEEEYIKRGWVLKNSRAFVDRESLDGPYHWYEKVRNDVAERQYNEIIEIAEKLNPSFSLDDNISDYGNTIKEEFFAEAFVNSQLGKPNDLGKAMNVWMKEKGLFKK